MIVPHRLFLFLLPFILITSFPQHLMATEQLSIVYHGSKEEKEYSHPALVIDNQAYLQNKNRQHYVDTGKRQGSPVIIVNKVSRSSTHLPYPGKAYSKHHGRYGYIKDDSFAIGYQSGDTRFLYVNGLRPNCCNQTIYVVPPGYLQKPAYPVQPGLKSKSPSR